MQADGGEVQPCTHPFHGAPSTPPPADLVKRFEDLKRRVDEEQFRQENEGRFINLDPAEIQRGKEVAGKAISRWADSAMFRSEPMPVAENGRVTPRAYLINATPDPLGSLAALNAIYTDGVKRSLSEVTDEERREALIEVRKNKLQGPLEVIQFHFLLEGVSRAFTHQIVRGRRAFYAQESLRFAVVEGEDWKDRVATPPGFDFWTEGQKEEWEAAIMQAEDSYARLVGSGIPAEDARGLMPHAMTTRIHWVCSLRELLYVAGVRLCTQAQFEWRTAMASVVQALRGYGYDDAAVYERPQPIMPDYWQFEEIATLLRPICYQEGECGFKSKFDRSCSIRERVDFREKHSTNRKDSSNWHKPMIADVIMYDKITGRPEIETVTSPGIDPAEWLADPNAAR
jgi:flavin-dependent thymidylate synthase